MTKDFIDKKIEQGKIKHNGKYTYEWLETHIPKNAKDDIIVHCPIHGDFHTTMDNHFNAGSGCPACAGRPKRSQEELLKKCEEKAKMFGRNYTFEKSVFGTMKEKVVMTCHEKDAFGNEHGDFEIELHSFLKGCKCPKCSKPHMNCTQDESTTPELKTHGREKQNGSHDLLNT